MSLDIVEGDIWVQGGAEYPIRVVGVRKWYGPASLSMTRMMRETGSTKRVPAMVAGKRGAATTNLTAIPCTTLDPANMSLYADVVKSDPRLSQLKAYATLYEVTILDGDRFLRLLVEEVK